VLFCCGAATLALVTYLRANRVRERIKRKGPSPPGLTLSLNSSPALQGNGSGDEGSLRAPLLLDASQ
jgi:hypothetical protein